MCCIYILKTLDTLFIKLLCRGLVFSLHFLLWSLCIFVYGNLTFCYYLSVVLFVFLMIRTPNLVSLDRLSALGQWDLVYLENQSALPICLLSVCHFVFYLTWIFWLWKSHAHVHPYPMCYWSMIHLNFNFVYWCFNPFLQNATVSTRTLNLCFVTVCFFQVNVALGTSEEVAAQTSATSALAGGVRARLSLGRAGLITQPTGMGTQTLTQHLKPSLSSSSQIALCTLWILCWGGNQSAEQTVFWYGFEDDNSI